MASDYQYLTTAEYVAYDLAVSGITNSTLAEKHISDAEKWIDAYCGPWPRYYPRLTGIPSAVDGATVTAGVFGSYKANYWAAGGLYLHVYDGAGATEERLILSSSSAGQVTLASAISGMDTSSRFVLRQKSVFPRYVDIDVANVPFLPQNVKLATAAQVAFAVQAGSEGSGLWQSDAVLSAKSDVTGESYSTGYSYQRNPNLSQGVLRFLAPQAVELLRGMRCSTGRIRRGWC